MKKSFCKIVSVLIAVMIAVSAMACMASAVKVDGCTCACSQLVSGSVNCTSKADDGIRDIYLVLDISGSMSGAPIANLKEAAKDFCKMMLNDVAGDNRIAIVTYATTASSYAFSTDINELSAIIDGIVAKGSTNMYDALMKVKEIDDNYSRENASKHVIVMADGLPNESATLTAGKYTSKDSTMYYKHGNAVYSLASGMWFDFNIYSIGFFHNIGGNQLKFGKVLMKDIQNKLYLEVFKPEEIIEAFVNVADCIIGCICADDCTCGDDYDCCACCTAPETQAPDNNGDNDNNNNNNNDNKDPVEDNKPTEDKEPDSIPQTGDSAVGVTAAAVMMLAGIAFVATKKREG